MRPCKAHSQFSMDVGNNLFFVSFSAAHPPNGCLIRIQGRTQTSFTYLITTTEIFPPYCSAVGDFLSLLEPSPRLLQLPEHCIGISRLGCGQGGQSWSCYLVRRPRGTSLLFSRITQCLETQQHHLWPSNRAEG